jgi:4'-phosphopantetheinyl transferase
MMIQWLQQSLRDMDDPPELFLGAAERARFDSFRFDKRRSDWLLGRWTAKRLLQAVLLHQCHERAPRRALEIVSDADGAPFARLSGQTLPFHLSISHSHGSALCAVDAEAIGIDLEWVEPREPPFIGDYLTPREQGSVNTAPPAQRDALVTCMWSAKEAVLKARRKGLSVDTRAVDVSIAPFEQPPTRWSPFETILHGKELQGPPLYGWWRIHGGFVLTLAAATRDAPVEHALGCESLESARSHDGTRYGMLFGGIA